MNFFQTKKKKKGWILASWLPREKVKRAVIKLPHYNDLLRFYLKQSGSRQSTRRSTSRRSCTHGCAYEPLTHNCICPHLQMQRERERDASTWRYTPRYTDTHRQTLVYLGTERERELVIQLYILSSHICLQYCSNILVSRRPLISN